MPIPTFHQWLESQDKGEPPAADKIVPTIAAAGPSGMTRRELASRSKLDFKILCKLLDALVGMGMLRCGWNGDDWVYVATTS